jgi:trans-aconitate methyltransferase
MSWNDQTVVATYSNSADDTAKSWYEEEVNTPSILALLPNERVRVLDFGCGPGNFTSRLAERYDVMGADSSELMVQRAQEKYSDIAFMVWDGLSALPGAQEPFAAIVTKLTLEFIEDLPGTAKHLFESLAPGGLLVVSAQHPLLAIAMHPEENIPYWGTPEFDVQIGTTGTTVTKIHRNLDDYTEPFIACGFRLDKIVEPQISDAIAKAHAARPIDLKFPKRLNIQFRKP